MYRTVQVFLLQILLSNCFKIRGQYTLSSLNDIVNGWLLYATMDKAIGPNSETNIYLNKIEIFNDEN